MAGQDVRRRAGWLPAGQDQLETWLQGHRQRCESRHPDQELRPSVEALRRLLDTDSVLRMHASQMLEQVPETRGYDTHYIESVDELLVMIDEVIGMAPEFGDSMVMSPVDGVLDWAKATPAGFAFFRDPRVNDAFRAILQEWSAYLSGPESLYVLNDTDKGWTSDAARAAIGIEQYQHDEADEHWGFASWNDFFTRRFAPDRRPVAGEGDDGAVVSPCEATPYRIARKVAVRDEFWAKAEPYSLDDMLAGDESVPRFEGGTVFQAYLSATDYHRWHAPVSGTVVRAWVQPGTYFSEADAQGADAAEPTLSQGYLAHVATRGIILIDADDASVGRVAVVFIGMSDVSSCVFEDGIREGAHVAKGDELGCFQYGGSTVCVVFEPDTIDAFALDAIPQPDHEQPTLLRVRSLLATTHAVG